MNEHLQYVSVVQVNNVRANSVPHEGDLGIT